MNRARVTAFCFRIARNVSENGLRCSRFQQDDRVVVSAHRSVWWRTMNREGQTTTSVVTVARVSGLASVFSLLLLLPIALVTPLPNSAAQGTFIMANYGNGVNAPVFDSDGKPLAGTVYAAMLYVGTAVDSLQAVPPLAPFLWDGYFYDGVRTAQGIPGGILVWTQVRAWDTRIGVTYEEVFSAGLGGYGQSQPFQLVSGGVGQGGFPAFLTSLESFSLLPVIPEPSLWQLGLLGLAGLLWFHHRRRRRGIANPGIEK